MDRGKRMISMTSRLWAWLQSVSPYPKSLAWCHTTDAFCFREIVETGVLTPKHCEVFSQELLYFFYGRPAYRQNSSEALRISARSPIVILLDPDLIACGSRMYPFDTGAFRANRYAHWIHADMSMDDFELACRADAPRRHVASFFGTNLNYLKLQARRPHHPFDGEYEVDSMAALLTDPSISSADDRRVAIELQLSEPVPLQAPQVKAIILPEELLQARFLQPFLEGAGASIEIYYYYLMPLKPNQEYQSLLEQSAIDLQRHWGME